MLFAVNLILSAQQRNVINVTVTVYNRGYRTADGTVIPWKQVKNGTFKSCAISPDLLKKNGGPYEFGDTIKVEGTKYDGWYVIHDLTSRRHRNWVDLLVPPTINHGRWKGKITDHRKKKK